MTQRLGRKAPPLDPVVVRLRDVGAIAAGLPHLMGFRPGESVVLIGLAGESGRRVVMTARADIPAPEHDRSLARMLARNLSTAHPEAALVLVVSEAANEAADGRPRLPHDHLVSETCRALERSGVLIADTALVRNGRWWSYDCAPDAGRPLPGGLSELEVASVATGTVVAGDREGLVARIAPPPGHDARTMAAACARVGAALSADVLDTGAEPAAAESWAAVMAGVARCRPGAAGGPFSDDDVARIVWGLRDGVVRDLALELALGDEPAAAEQLWTECTRRAPAPLDAAPATLLAVCAWLRGDGAMANIALDRALTSVPGYGLAGLLRGALDACVTPTDLRALLTAAATQPAG